jgi:1,4-dihydroxy-2-naphthoyl-CoA hydrolase
VQKPIWVTTPSLAELNSPAPTLTTHLDIQFTEIGADYLVATMPVDHRTHQPFGLLHGGASVVLAETVASVGTYLTLDPKTQAAVGLEINANHIRGVRDGFVVATGRPLHRGKSTQVWDIRIADKDGRLVCVARATIAIIAQ